MNIKLFRWLIVWVLADALGFCHSDVCAQAAAPLPTPSAEGRIQLIGGGEDCVSRVRVGQKLVLSYGDLQAVQGTLATNGVRFTVKDRGRFWRIQAIDKEIVVSAEEVPGWEATLAVSEEAVFEFCKESKVLRVQTLPESPGNTEVSRARMAFPDGAVAEMGPGSRVQVESFSDTTYVLSGSGAVTGTTASQERFTFGSTELFMAGGGLKRSVEAVGVEGGASRSPAVSVSLRGLVGGNVELDIAGQRATVGASSGQTFSTANGTVLRIDQDTSRSVLVISVKKGLVTLEPVELGAGSAVLLSGRTAFLTWDFTQKSFNVEHGLGDGPVFTRLPEGSIATLASGSAMKVVRTSSGIFSAQTTKGRVTLLDKISQEVMALSATPRMFEIPSGVESAGRVARIHLIGASGDTFQIQVNGSLHGAADGAKGSGGLAEAGVELKRLLRGTRWLIQSLDRPAEITIRGLPGWKAILDAGESVTCAYSEDRGLIEVATAHGSKARVEHVAQVLLPDGTSAALGLYSIARTDYFKDGTYSFFGTGGVAGTSAAGAGFSFGAGHPPITGGDRLRLQSAPSSSGVPARSPDLAMKLRKESKDRWLVDAGGRSFTVSAAGGEKAAFANGTSFELALEGTNGALKITAVKLLAHLEIAGFESVRARLLSGQTAILEADLAKKTAEFTQLNGEGMLTLVFQNQSTASLSPNGRLRVVEQGPDKLALQTVAGEVTYFDSVSGQISGVGPEAKVVIRSGGVSPRTSVRLLGSVAGTYRISVDERSTFGAEDVRMSKGSIVFRGVELQPIDRGSRWLIKAVDREAQISASAMGSWKTDLARGESITVSYWESRSTVELRTEQALDRGREDLARITLPDGGGANLGPFSFVRTDLFVDGTYALSGRGLVKGLDADGNPFDLGSSPMPLGGGPMKSVLDPNGGSRLARSTPFSAIHVKREGAGSVEIEADSQRFTLTSGTTNRVRTPNGTEVQFSLDLRSQLLAALVVKGFVGLKIPELESVTPVLLSGQSLGIERDGRGNAVGFLHLQGPDPIVLGLPDSSGVVLNPDSSVRLEKEGASTMVVHATKGKSAIWESRGIRALDLDATERLSVVRRGEQRGGPLVTKIELLGGPQEGFRVRINGGRVFGFEDFSRGKQAIAGVEFSPAQKGTRWLIRSVEKVAKISARALGQWHAEVNLGESATVWYAEALALVDVTTSQSASSSTNALVRLGFSDEAIAVMGPYSSARTDVMNDGTYTFSGAGVVKGITAGGKNFVLGKGTAFVNGGVSRTGPSAEGDPRELGLGGVSVILHRDPSGGLVIEVNGQKSPLTGTSAMKFALSNGTLFEVALKGKEGGVRVDVSKGLIQLRVASMEEIGTSLMTGHGVTLHWDQGRHSMDLERTRGESLVVVSLPDQSTAALGILGTIRFIREDPTTYSVAALAGQVTLWDVSSNEVTSLTPQKWVRLVEGPVQGLLTQVRFIGSEGNVFRLQINGKGSYGVEDAAKSQGVLKLEGLEFRPAEGGARWIVQSHERPAEVTGDSLGVWRAELALGEAATFTYSGARACVEVFTGDGSNKSSTSLVALKLAQGSVAVVGPYSTAKSDLFRDGSFILTGSGRVEGTLADGRTFDFGESRLPIAGGPRVKPAEARDGESSIELSPTTPVRVRGVVGAAEIDVAGQKFVLAGASSKKVSLPNGSELEFSQTTGKPVLRCLVKKGHMMLELPELGTGNLFAISDQSIALSWNPQDKSHEISHTAEGGLVHFVFPDDSVARLRPGSAIRIRRESSDKVTAELTLGMVALWESASNRARIMTVEKQTFAVEPQGIGRTTHVHLVGAGGKEFKIRINGRRVFGYEDVVKAKGRLILEGLAIEAVQQGSRWVVHSIAREAEVTSESIGGWKAVVLLGESATFDYTEQKAAVETRTLPGASATARDSMKVRLPDGATASIGSGSYAKVDHFSDGSYTFSGFGAITGSSADGKPFALNGSMLPFTGGPLKKPQVLVENRGPTRATPAILGTFHGSIGGDIQISLEGQKAIVGTSGIQRVTTPAGTEIECSQDPVKRFLNVMVIKGNVTLEWDAFAALKFLLLSDQAVQIGLDSSKRVAEIVHGGGLEPFQLILPNGSLASLTSGGAIRVARESQDAFSVQTLRGEASFWDLASQQLLSLGLQKRLFVSSSQKDPSLTRVTLMGAGGDVFKIKIHDRPPVSFEDAMKAKGKLVIDGVELQPSQKGELWVIRSLEHAVEVGAAPLGSWKAGVPMGEAVSIRYSEPRAFVELTTGQGKTADSKDLVRMQMPDGTMAAMGPASKTRTDVYKDGTYMLVGNGEVGGLTADGRSFAFNGGQLPIAGGPLRKIVESPGKEVVVRGTPTLEVRVNGQLGSDIELSMGDKKITLGSTGLQKHTAPNGTELEFSQDLIRRNLRVSVKKGHILFSVEGTTSITPVAVSDQIIGLGWMPDQKHLDLSQLSNDGILQIGLPNRSVVQLSTNSVVRILRDAGNAFTAQTLRGRAVVWESATGQIASLGAQPRNFTITSEAQGPVARVHFLGVGGDVFKARVNDGSVLSFEEAAKNKGRLIVEGLELEPVQGGRRWVVGAVERSAEITAEGLGAWKAELAAGESATFGYSQDRAWIEVATGQSSTSDLKTMVQIHFPDGAKAVLGPNSLAQTELFKDLSYYLSGSGAVSGSTADGKAFSFWSGQDSITGGPLREISDGKGGRTTIRLTPTTDVTIRGTLGAVLEIAVGEQSIRVEPGRRASVNLSNGTELEFFQDAVSQMLNFIVVKGYIAVSIPEIHGWKPLGRSGQEQGLQWNVKLKTADLLNKSSDLPVLVLLPSRTLASVAPGAVFQYTSLGDAVYSTAAAGGKVTLVNTVTHKEISLTGENKLVENGRISRGGVVTSASSKEPIGLKWDFGLPLILEGISQDPVMQPNSEKRMKIGSSHELSIAYGDEGSVNFMAVDGDFEISIKALNGLKIEVSEGDAVTLTLDIRKGTFIATTDEGNSHEIIFTTPDGSTPKLAAANSLNFDLRKDGGLIARSNDGKVTIADFAGAGTDSSLGGLNPARPGTKNSGAVLSPSTEIDASRIIELEASPTGANSGR